MNIGKLLYLRLDELPQAIVMALKAGLQSADLEMAHGVRKHLFILERRRNNSITRRRKSFHFHSNDLYKWIRICSPFTLKLHF
jgi:hypothetical protein